MLHLGWVKNGSFNIEKPKDEDINPNFSDFIWIETVDNLKGKKRLCFRPKLFIHCWKLLKIQLSIVKFLEEL